MIATAIITILPKVEHWVGDSDITQPDGTRAHTDFTFVTVNPDAHRSVQEFQVLNGTVQLTKLPSMGSGCWLSVNPRAHSMGAAPNRVDQSEGRLVVDKSNPKQWLITGGGQSIWLVDEVAHCPKADSVWEKRPVHAPWWPPTFTEQFAPTAINITPEETPDFIIKIDNPMGRGTVHLKYDKSYSAKQTH